MSRVYCDMSRRILDQFWKGPATEKEYYEVLLPASSRLLKLSLNWIEATYK